MHEAAHAVVAWRVGGPGGSLSIEDAIKQGSRPLDGCTVCDWKSLHNTLDDITVCRQGIAIAFAGAAMDATSTGESVEAALRRLPTDARAMHDATIQLRMWVESISQAEVDAVTSRGQQLATSIVNEEMSRIERLAQVLLARGTMDETSLGEWFSDDSL